MYDKIIQDMVTKLEVGQGMDELHDALSQETQQSPEDQVLTEEIAAPAEKETAVAEPAEEEAPAAEETPAEEELQKQAPAGPDFLEMTIQSCVLPLEMRMSQINDVYKKLPVAYRTYTYMNSVIEGVVPPEKYTYAADQTDRGVRLSKWNIGEAVNAYRQFAEAGRRVDFITARVSPQIVREVDFYGYIKEILDQNKFDQPEKICLEFPRTVLYEDPEKVRMALLSMKLLKVRSLLSGCGERDCPVTPLIDLPFDFVLLAPWLVAYAGDRNKTGAFESLIGFIHGTGARVICDGVKTDAQISVLLRSECYGYVPSPAYQGSVEHGRLRMPISEALLQNDEEEL